MRAGINWRRRRRDASTDHSTDHAAQRARDHSLGHAVGQPDGHSTGVAPSGTSTPAAAPAAPLSSGPLALVLAGVLLPLPLLLLLFPSVSLADGDARSISVPLIGTQGVASRYPSTIIFTPPGGPTQFGGVRIALHRVTHPCPEDLAVLLVHAGGGPTHRFLLMSNAGGCRPLEGTDIVFRSGAPSLPDDEPASPAHGELLEIGPSNYGVAPEFPAPAPAGPYTLGLPPTGDPVGGAWLLYVIDTRAEYRGVIAAGWSVQYDAEFYTESDQTNVAIPGVGTGPGGAAQYPITFDLTGAREDARVRDVILTLVMGHNWPDNLRILLESPSGTSVIVMANAGGGTPMPLGPPSPHFRDDALGFVPNAGPIGVGGYKPGSVYEAIIALGAPAPQPPYATEFAAFDDEAVAGTWRLWIYDDSAMNSGTLSFARLFVGTNVPPVLSLQAPAPASSATQPFIRLQGNVSSGNGPLIGPLTTLYSATWRVTNGGTLVDAGPLNVRIADTLFSADVPVRNGMNDVTVSVTNAHGVRDVVQRTVSVDEFTYALSEGATGSFFDLDVTIGNVHGVPAPIAIDFLPEQGTPVGRQESVPQQSARQIRVDDYVPDAAVSSVVHSTDAVPLAVERTMSWDARGYGGHGGSAIAPATRWFFAEGAQGTFDTYVLLANGGGADADVTVNFLLEGGGVVPHAVTVPAFARRTVDASTIPAIAGQSFGISILSSEPITAERAMYFPHDGARVFEGGHESAGVTEPSRFWLLAEGATGPFFECYVLLMNPNAAQAEVTVTYLLPDGSTIAQPVTMAPNSRQTINVETVDSQLLNTPVSVSVNADLGIVVERAMYWPDVSLGWREAHNSFGVTQLGLRWAVADGRIGGPRGHDTYILLANPNAFPAEVEVRFFKGGASVTRTYTLAPTSRLNVWTSQDVPELGEGTFTAEIAVLNYVPIAVEKAMYWNADGVAWAAGTNVTATRLPPR